MRLLDKIKIIREVLKKGVSVSLTDAKQLKAIFRDFLFPGSSSVNSGYVGACANIWGLSFAKSKLRVYNSDSDNEEWENHPAVLLLSKPFPGYTGWELLYRIATDLIFEGNCYILKLRPQSSLSPVSGLYPLQADKINTYPYNIERIDRYEYNTGEGITHFDPLDIIHFKSPDRKSVIKGSPIIDRIKDIVDVEKMQIEYRKKFYQKAGFLGATFTTEANMDPESFARAKDMLETKYGGSENVFKAALFDNGLKPVPTAYSLKDMQIMDDRKLNMEEICSAFGVNKLLFGQSENIQRGNADTVYYVFYSTVIDPLLNYIDQALTNQFLSVDYAATDGSTPLYFGHDILASRDKEADYKNYESAIKSGWLAPDEVRIQEGYNPLGGEYALPKLNINSQAAPAV